MSTEGHWRHCEQIQALVRCLTGEGSRCWPAVLLPRRSFPLGIFWGIANRLDGSRADGREERAVGDQPGGAEVEEESFCHLKLPSGRL